MVVSGCTVVVKMMWTANADDSGAILMAALVTIHNCDVPSTPHTGRGGSPRTYLLFTHAHL